MNSFKVGDRVFARRPNGDACADGEIIYLYHSNREALVRGKFYVYEGDFICRWEDMELND